MSKDEHRTIVLPRYFSGEDDFEAWAQHFSHCARANSWDDDQQRHFLPVRLTGEALQAYVTIADPDQLSIKELFENLKARFAPPERRQLHRAEFRTRRRRAGETLGAYSDDVAKLARQAFPDLPRAVQDEMALEQFIDGLDTAPLRIKVREQAPKSLLAATRRALLLESLYEAEAIDRVREATPVAAPAQPTATSSSTTQPAGTPVAATRPPSLEAEMLNLLQSMNEKLSLLTAGPTYSPDRRDRLTGGPYQGYQRNGRSAPPRFNGRCFGCNQFGHRQIDCPHQRRSGN